MAIPFLGLSLLNTFIGLENVNRNAAQYAKQKIANYKIDKILELLETGDMNMDLQKYIAKVDAEIAALIQKESENATTSGERDLHYLFENRKHAFRWAAEKGFTRDGKMTASEDSPSKDYFGGM